MSTRVKSLDDQNVPTVSFGQHPMAKKRSVSVMEKGRGFCLSLKGVVFMCFQGKKTCTKYIQIPTQCSAMWCAPLCGHRSIIRKHSHDLILSFMKPLYSKNHRRTCADSHVHQPKSQLSYLAPYRAFLTVCIAAFLSKDITVVTNFKN